jgi:hypothetical protein
LDWTVRDAELIAALARLVEQKPTVNADRNLTHFAWLSPIEN